jgi:hypothetical protein
MFDTDRTFALLPQKLRARVGLGRKLQIYGVGQGHQEVETVCLVSLVVY